MSGSLAIAILAAGEGSRFGGGKLDAEIAGVAVGQRVMDVALELDQLSCAIVVRDPAPRFAAKASALRQVEIIVNSRAGAGLGTSVACAASWAVKKSADRLLLLLADMPFISADTLRKIDAAADDGKPAAIHYPEGRAGIPACFPSGWFPRLIELDGERGASDLLKAATGLELVEAPQGELRDIDTQLDLAAARGEN